MDVDSAVIVMRLIVILSAIAIAVDASRLGARRGVLGGGFLDMGPAAWFFAVLLFWIIALPCYLVVRPRLVQASRRGGYAAGYGAAHGSTYGALGGGYGAPAAGAPQYGHAVPQQYGHAVPQQYGQAVPQQHGQAPPPAQQFGTPQFGTPQFGTPQFGGAQQFGGAPSRPVDPAAHRLPPLPPRPQKPAAD